MIFSRSFLLALVSVPFVVLAQQPNPPTLTTYNVTAGQPFTLTWSPTTEGTVSLVLRQGASSNLEAGSIIASNITNSGSYTWDVPSSEVRGSDYTIEIVDDTDNSQVNYTPYFVLESTNTVASVSLSSVTLGAPSTSLSLSTASATASPSAFPLQSGITLSTASLATTGTASSSTGSSSSTGTGSKTTSASTASTSSQAGLQASATTTNGGARATAMIGMLGAVALGALAL